MLNKNLSGTAKDDVAKRGYNPSTLILSLFHSPQILQNGGDELKKATHSWDLTTLIDDYNAIFVVRSKSH
jgi:hypothetical protein